MSISKRGDEKGRPFKSMGDHNVFLSRITKTLYYAKLPKTERLSLPVSELASDLFSEFQQGQSINLLYCEEVAAISRNACISPCSLVLALLYLERLKTCNVEYLRCIAPSKLFLISLMISSKYLHDDGEEDEVFADEWARSGDISVGELCQLEKEFLKAIDWNVFVYESTFWERLKKLEEEIAFREGMKRGWFTYGELNCLIKKYDIPNILNSFISFSAVLAAAYTAGILTLVGSVFLTSKLPGTSLYLQSNKIFSDALVVPVLEPNQSLYLEDKRIAPEVFKTIDTEKYISSNKSAASTVSVLNTSILLVSILTCNENQLYCDKTDNVEGTEQISWDWWNNSLLIWLSDISQSNENQKLMYPDSYYKNFAHDTLLDMSIVNQKILELEDKIHKATKLRLQEQIERSWHEEWTDTIYTTLGSLYPISVY